MEEFKLSRPIKHLAIIMDGNGRWAKKRNLPRTLGHKKACETLIEVIRETCKLDIYCLSIYAFSTENWNRPKDEIDHLFKYLDIFFKTNIKEMMDLGIKIRIMGDYTKLPKHTVKTIEKSLEDTKNNTKHVLNIALNYGSRPEIIRATKLIMEDYKNNKISLDDINEETYKNYLYTKDLPEIDLLIRTSGEQRLSNFMLYQLSYSEFIFTPTYFPDFHKEELIDCLKIFEKRDRRFGTIKE
ncbi:MAG: isoprenyl transferase [Bacilli bacterium]